MAVMTTDAAVTVHVAALSSSPAALAILPQTVVRLASSKSLMVPATVSDATAVVEPSGGGGGEGGDGGGSGKEEVQILPLSTHAASFVPSAELVMLTHCLVLPTDCEQTMAQLRQWGACAWRL